MDLNQLIRTLRRHWFVAFCAFAAVMALGLAAAFLPQKQYEASATVLVSPNQDSDPSSAAQAVQVGLTQIAAQVSARNFSDTVFESLPAPFAQSATTVTTKTNPDSGVLTITASGPNPAATAPIANAHAKRVIAKQDPDGFWVLSVLDPAITPTAPSSPVKGPILVGAFVLALVAALLVALLAGSLSKRVRRADELRAELGASVLAEVPNAPRKLNLDRLWATLPPQDAPALVESLQQLRTNVELAMPRTPEGFVVTITSASDGEGKSTIAANLAWLLAAVGHDVVLIDADLRRPSLSRMFQQRPGAGLSSAAASQSNADILQTTRLSNLMFLPAGIPDRHPAEVISTALPRVLQTLRSPDRIVIVDAPPLLSTAETAMIASITGAAILVIDTRQRDPEEFERAVLELQDRDCRLFGIVLNRVRTHQTRRRTSGQYVLDTPVPPSTNVRATNGNGHSPQLEQPVVGRERTS
jgi:capsular exopolysaccharide synthesis family protein